MLGDESLTVACATRLTPLPADGTNRGVLAVEHLQQ